MDEKVTGPHKVRLGSRAATYAAELGVIVEKEIGHGSYGRVYLCTHPEHGACAMKVGNQKGNTRRQVKAMEAIIKKRAKDPKHKLEHLPTLLSKSADSMAYLMEYYPGGTLGDFIDYVREHPEDFEKYDIDSVISKYNWAYAQIREANIAHSDLHTNNILYNRETRKLVIIDVGATTATSQNDSGLRVYSELINLRSYIALYGALRTMRDYGVKVPEDVQRSAGMYWKTVPMG